MSNFISQEHSRKHGKKAATQRPVAPQSVIERTWPVTCVAKRCSKFIQMGRMLQRNTAAKYCVNSDAQLL
jgi:hypothetical protein